jgi:hypothetical protein
MDAEKGSPNPSLARESKVPAADGHVASTMTENSPVAGDTELLGMFMTYLLYLIMMNQTRAK